MLPPIDMTDFDPNTAYCGVGKFKLPASHPFNKAGYIHDKRYETWPCKSTKEIDLEFLYNCDEIAFIGVVNDRITAGQAVKLWYQARRYYRLTRIWGTGRYWYAKARGWDSLLG